MRSGREDEFARVYDEYVWEIYGFFGYRLGTREEAEDLTQATFERALRAWARFDPRRGSVRTWLFAIGRNLLADHYRRGRSARERPIGPGDGEVNEDELGAYELDERLTPWPELETALSNLGDRERELLALRYGGGLSGREVAQLTGLSVANVQQILSRTLRRLREDLDAERSVTVARTSR